MLTAKSPGDTEEEFLVNALLINLTRLGDLLQTQAAVADLRRQGMEVGVVCLENFAGAAALLRGVSHVDALPGASLLAALAEAGEYRETEEGLLPRRCLDWCKAPARLLHWRETLFEQFRPDVVCNLTPSLSARLLARFLAGCGTVIGFGLDTQGFGCNSNSWAAFLMGAAVARGVSPFNVADLFRMTVAGGEGRGDAALQRPDGAVAESMKRRLEEAAPSELRGFGAIQLGASEERRRWPAEFFAAVGDMLWEERRLFPILLGNASERPLVAEYARAARHPFVSLCGETSLEELAAALQCCRLLTTNDTGTMHLAAGLGISVVAVFLATAQPFDTGPYQRGSYCVEPDMPCHPCSFDKTCHLDHACRYAVKPEALFTPALELADCAQSGSKERFSLSGGRIWLCEYDDAGFMSLVSRSGHERENRTVGFQIQRHILRQFLDRKRSATFVPVLSIDGPRMSDEGREQTTAELREAAALMLLVEQRGRMILARPLPTLREKFMDAWDRVYRTLRQSTRLGALAVLWLEETQAEGQDFPIVLAVIADCITLLHALDKQINQL
jgi:ADP-heptose:LPS heptosyltransferase